MAGFVGISEKRDRVRRRVMQSGYEERVFGNVHALLLETEARLRIVEQDSQQSRRDLPGLAAASAAVIGAVMRIVAHGGAVADEQHETGKGLAEAHRLQDGLGGGDLVRSRQRRIEARRRIGAALGA